MGISRWMMLLGLLFLFACNVKNYNDISMYSSSHRLQAVVEIPAGTNHLIEYCGMTNRFIVRTEKDSNAIVKYLPYPFNFGFIPSTMLLENDVSGQPIDVLILSETLRTGEVIEIVPIGMVTLRKAFNTLNWIVAVPYEQSKRVIDVENLNDLKLKEQGIPDIIRDWLYFSDPSQKTEVVSWQDELLATKLIETCAVK